MVLESLVLNDFVVILKVKLQLPYKVDFVSCKTTDCERLIFSILIVFTRRRDGSEC